METAVTPANWARAILFASGLAAVIYIILWMKDDGNANLTDVTGTWRIDPAATAWCEAHAGELPPINTPAAGTLPNGRLARDWADSSLVITLRSVTISNGTTKPETMVFKLACRAPDALSLDLGEDRLVSLILDEDRLVWREGSQNLILRREL